MKATTQKLAIIKVPETPDETDLKIVSELFKNTDFKPICVKEAKEVNGNLIIG